MSRARKQAYTRSVSIYDIVASRAFAYGLDEARRGIPFNPDLYPGNQSWNYERGRALAFIVPIDWPLRVNGKLNPKIRQARHDGVQTKVSAMTKRPSKKTATGDKVELALARIAANLRNILRKFTEWLATFDLSPRSAYDRIAVAKYVKKKGNSATIAEWTNVAPGVMYFLAEEVYPAPVESEIIKQAKAGIPIDQNRAKAIVGDHDKREREKREREEQTERDREAKAEAAPKASDLGKPAAARPDLDPLFDQINAKLVANDDPRRLTCFSSPLGLNYVLEGPTQPDGRPEIPGNLDHDDLARLAKELTAKAPTEAGAGQFAPAAAPEAAPAAASEPPPAPEPAANAAVGSADSANAETNVAAVHATSKVKAKSPAAEFAAFEAAIVYLNKLVSKPPATFAGTKPGGETLRRVADYLIDIANCKQPPPFEPPQHKRSQASTEETTESSAEQMKAAHAAAEHGLDPPTKMRWGRAMVGGRDMSKSGGEGVTYCVERVTTWTDEHTGTNNFKVWFADNGEFNAAKSISDNVELKTKEAAAKAFAARHRASLVIPMIEQGLSQIPPTSLSATGKSTRGKEGTDD